MVKLSELQDLYDKHKDHFVVVGIHSSDNADGFEDAVKKLGLQFPVGIDAGKTLDSYGVESLPSYFLISKEGTLLKAFMTTPPIEQELLELFDVPNQQTK